MSKLPNLMDDICGVLAFYFSGRSGGQSSKTAFILCDDYVELLSKLFLIEDSPEWSENKNGGRFKNFHDVLTDVEILIGNSSPNDLARLKDLTTVFHDRRVRRNDFFHSAYLLDLNINPRGCVEALSDLLSYGLLLFRDHWKLGVRARPRMSAFDILIKLERLSSDDPTIWSDVDVILKSWPRRNKEKNSIKKIGTQYAEHPDDLHLRMCVDCDGKDLAVALQTLLLRIDNAS